MMMMMPMTMVKTRSSRDQLPKAPSIYASVVSIVVAVAGVDAAVVAVAVPVIMIRALAVIRLPPTPFLLLSREFGSCS